MNPKVEKISIYRTQHLKIKLSRFTNLIFIKTIEFRKWSCGILLITSRDS